MSYIYLIVDNNLEKGFIKGVAQEEEDLNRKFKSLTKEKQKNIRVLEFIVSDIFAAYIVRHPKNYVGTNTKVVSTSIKNICRAVPKEIAKEWILQHKYIEQDSLEKEGEK